MYSDKQLLYCVLKHRAFVRRLFALNRSQYTFELMCVSFPVTTRNDVSNLQKTGERFVGQLSLECSGIVGLHDGLVDTPQRTQGLPTTCQLGGLDHSWSTF